MACPAHSGRNSHRAGAVTPPALRDLLADSLALWGVEGRVRVADEGVHVSVGEVRLEIMPAVDADSPIRWWILRDGRRRPCPSMLGLLRSLRNALGVPGAAPARARVAAAP